MISKQKGCRYTKLANGIHEFVFTEASHEAVDSLTSYIKTILDTTPIDAPTTCYLIDNSQTVVVSLTYLRSRVKELSAHRPKGRAPARVAVIYEGMMGSLANSILAATMKNHFRFFKPAERDAAISWLLKDQ